MQSGHADLEVVEHLECLVGRGVQFGTLYADPPWPYEQSPRGAAKNHYPTMSLEALKRMPVAKLALPNSHLHLWATHSFFSEAELLLNAWGFDYKSVFVWVKPQLGMGHYWRSSAEFLLLGTRGHSLFRDCSIPNWMCIPRGRHSEKPELFRQLVELVSPPPRLELFARRTAPGWVAFGNQVGRMSDTPLGSDLFSEVASETEQSNGHE